LQSRPPRRAVLLQLDRAVFRYDSRQAEVAGIMNAWSDDNWMQEFEDSITSPHPRSNPDVGSQPAQAFVGAAPAESAQQQPNGPISSKTLSDFPPPVGSQSTAWTPPPTMPPPPLPEPRQGAAASGPAPAASSNTAASSSRGVDPFHQGQDPWKPPGAWYPTETPAEQSQSQTAGASQNTQAAGVPYAKAGFSPAQQQPYVATAANSFRMSSGRHNFGRKVHRLRACRQWICRG